MTPSEFKSWFDGFTEAMEKTPTKAQWTRIKERVAEIDGKPVTERVFIDRYWPTYPNYYYHYPYWGWLGGGTISANNTGLQGLGQNLSQMNSCSNQGVGDSNQWINLACAQGFNSNSAMLALGKADYSVAN